MNERPFLTARWTELLIFNFAVPSELVAGLAPPGTEVDLFEGQALVSIVGFRFQRVRVFGVPIPGHTNFEEINLRYYVKRVVDGEVRRGVVFVREIVPRRAVALVANKVYYENYVTRAMRSQIAMRGSELGVGDTIEYGWQSGSRRTARLNRLAARVAGPLERPAGGSMEEFIVEHYWGYTRGRNGCGHEYRVAHVPWRVAAADDVVWDCDVGEIYEGPFAQHLSGTPVSAFVADGSGVEVFGGKAIS